jgi:hypothetical protein
MKQFRETDYYITKDGGVYRNNKKLKPLTQGRQYPYVSLYLNKKQFKFSIHRLVGEVYLPNPSNKKQINHINGKKDDNRLENLEWVNQSENQLHAYKHGLQGRKYKYDRSLFITLFNSGITPTEMTKALGIKDRTYIYKMISDYNNEG